MEDDSMAVDNKRMRKSIQDFVDSYLEIEKQESKIAEDSYCHKFWFSFLANVFNESEGGKFLDFEKKIKDRDNNTKRIDVYIKQTRVIIEQKSSNVLLDKPQQGHDNKTPFEQAREYQDYLPTSEKAKWIVVSNFREFQIYNMDSAQPLDTKVSISLEELPKRYHEFRFLIDNTAERIIREKEISFKAGTVIGDIYKLLLAEYSKFGHEITEKDYQDLNIICVRLVFCLFAEDSGMFSEHQQFGNFLNRYRNDPSVLRLKLKELFSVLNTVPEQRDRWLEKELASFDYVNGGLFSDNVDIPPLSSELVNYLIDEASVSTNWNEISPTIFGAIFESTLNKETRRSGGMHYTSIENIHKVIDPLFLDDLKAEFHEILEYRQENVRKQKLLKFQEKMASLTFLDPACGSGNFLTETYISLRKLEDQVLLNLMGRTYELIESETLQIRVSIKQFYGIEINDFAVDVAKTALWIAEYQCLQNTLDMNIPLTVPDTLPLKANDQIKVGNALLMDWDDVIHSSRIHFIMGNPPFNGAMTIKNKRAELEFVFPECLKIGEIDYVSGWYVKAARYIKNNKSIHCAFVSTNSLCQGQSVDLVWKPLINQLDLRIDFAWTTFIWDNEASNKAKVHCIIVGFSNKNSPDSPKLELLSSSGIIRAKHISPYLIDAKNIFIESRGSPISAVSSMKYGSMPRDGGNLIVAEDIYEQIKFDQNTAKYIRLYLGAEEFINNKKRYCLWLKDASPADINKSNFIKERVLKCKKFRLSSKAGETRKMADIAHLFAQRAQPEVGQYLLIPRVSSEKRFYIPIGFLSFDTIASDAAQIIPNATMFEFAIIISSLHMAWMRVVAGRLESRYRYSKDIVYNNFVWVKPTEQQRANIEKSAQAIIDARNKYPDSSLADLYDETCMPVELRKAHYNNDQTVLQLYGLAKNCTEDQMVARMFELYEAKISGVNNTGLELL